MSNSLTLKVSLEAFDKASKTFDKIYSAGKKLTGGMEAAQKTLGDLKSLEKNVVGYRKLGEQYRNTSSKLGDARAKLATLQQQTKNMTTVSESHRKKLSKAGQQVKKLKQSQGSFVEQIKESSAHLKSHGIDIKKLSHHEQSLSQKIDKASFALDKQSNKMRKAEARTKRLRDAQKKLHATMSFAANMSFAGGAGLLTGKAVSRGMFNMIAPGIALEDQMAILSGVTGATKDSKNFKSLKKMVSDLGGSTSFTGLEVSEGMTQLARTGFDVEKILASTGDVLNLARSTNTDLGETAKISSDIMSAMNIPADQMGRVADALAFTDNKSNNTLLELGEAMKYVAPIAKTVGMDLESTLAVLAKLGDAGLKGSMAGTSFKRVLGNIAANDSALETIEELGIIATNAEGNMRPMIDILEEVKQETAHLGNSEQLRIMKEIAGQHAFTAFTVMTDQQEKILEKQKEIRKNIGYSLETAKNMDDTTGGDIRLMNSAFENLRTTIFYLNSGGLRELIQNVTQIIGRTTEWTKANPELIGQISKAAAIFTGLAVTGGGFLLFVSAILAPIKLVTLAYGFAKIAIFGFAKSLIFMSGGAVFKVIGLIGKITGAQWALNLAMAANPLGIVVAGIAALIAIGGALYYWWDEITEGASKFFNLLYDYVPFLREFVELIKFVAGGIGSGIGAIGSLVASVFPDSDLASKVITDSPIASSRQQQITDNSQVTMNLHVDGGDPEEVRRVVNAELENHERKKFRGRMAAYAAG